MGLKVLMTLAIGIVKILRNEALQALACGFLQRNTERLSPSYDVKAAVLRPRMYRFPLAKKTNIKGFSLIELLLVVTLLIVLAGLNLPAFKNTYNRLKLENCALNIISLARYAQQRAIVDAANYQLHFDTTKKNYWLTRLAGDTTQKEERLHGRFSQDFQIPSDISADTSADSINFYPNADSDEAIIVLTNDRLRYEIKKSGAFGEFKLSKE
jgi:Tfp pilus assembly protein FimT